MYHILPMEDFGGHRHVDLLCNPEHNGVVLLAATDGQRESAEDEAALLKELLLIEGENAQQRIIDALESTIWAIENEAVSENKLIMANRDAARCSLARSIEATREHGFWVSPALDD